MSNLGGEKLACKRIYCTAVCTISKTTISHNKRDTTLRMYIQPTGRRVHSMGFAFVTFGICAIKRRTFPTTCDATPRVCRVCKSPFTKSSNSPTACRYHTATWMGAENSKHYGGAPAGSGTKYGAGVSYFWDCT